MGEDNGCGYRDYSLRHLFFLLRICDWLAFSYFGIHGERLYFVMCTAGVLRQTSVVFWWRFLEVLEMERKKLVKRALAVFGVFGVSASGIAQAAGVSVLTTGMTTALEEGFESLQLTVVDVITAAWPFMLMVLALYAAPTVVKKLWNMVTR
jgi:hypothetical protein